MRSRSQLGHRHSSFEAINVTPLIDVVMCLVIFFLIVGKMAADASAVRLPESGVGRAEVATQAVVIAIAPAVAGANQGGIDLGGVRARVWVDGSQATGLNELRAMLRERGARVLGATGQAGNEGDGSGASLADLPVHIRADRELAFAAVEPILRICAELGITGVRLAAERQP
jgi:biopolymer transport protein ExbD